MSDHIPIKSGDSLPKWSWDKSFDPQYMGTLAAVAHAVLNGRGAGYRISENGLVIQDPRQTNYFHPFKIYNVAGKNCPAAATGYDPATQQSVTFRVQSGIVGIRGVSGIISAVDTALAVTKSGEVQLEVISGTNGVLPTQVGAAGDDDLLTDASGQLGTLHEVLIVANNNTPITVTNYEYAATFIVPTSNPDGDGVAWASWWIQYDEGATPGTTDDAKIYCRSLAGAGFPSGPQASDLFPLGANIIPIGYAYGKVLNGATPIANPKFVIVQLLYDNAINRYSPVSDLSSPVQASLHFRGDWDDDSLAGKFFYDGDIVKRADSSMSHGGATYNQTGAWVHSGHSTEASIPTIGTQSGNWIPISGFFLT
jgi:hypothetical protein